MEAFESSPITVEVSHAPNPLPDLVAGHVTPVAVQSWSLAAGQRRYLGRRISSLRQEGMRARRRHYDSGDAGAGPERQGCRCEMQEGGCKSNPANAFFGCTSESNPEDARRWVCYCRVQRVRRNGRKEKIAQERYKDMEASCGRSFNIKNCWKLLQHSQKWELIDKETPPKRASLTEMDMTRKMMMAQETRTSRMETRRPRTRSRGNQRHQACVIR
ncbi:Lactation elevated protein 1 [Hordeum vulgare]|nr:Lactation elevated protein 1 [Hordeum vulgare]